MPFLATHRSVHRRLPRCHPHLPPPPLQPPTSPPLAPNAPPPCYPPAAPPAVPSNSPPLVSSPPFAFCTVDHLRSVQSPSPFSPAPTVQATRWQRHTVCMQRTSAGNSLASSLGTARGSLAACAVWRMARHTKCNAATASRSPKPPRCSRSCVRQSCTSIRTPWLSPVQTDSDRRQSLLLRRHARAVDVASEATRGREGGTERVDKRLAAKVEHSRAIRRHAGEKRVLAAVRGRQ